MGGAGGPRLLFSFRAIRLICRAWLSVRVRGSAMRDCFGVAWPKQSADGVATN
jgi:hypothetical protein